MYYTVISRVIKVISGRFILYNKLIEINDYATFSKFICGKNNWDGNLQKNNIVYAPNGSGKTSFSLIFQSLSENNNQMILKKKRLSSNNNPTIKLRDSENRIVEFKNNKWNFINENIMVFNSFYFSSNVYSFNFNNENMYLKYFTKEDMNDMNKLKSLFKNRKTTTQRRRNKQYKIKSGQLQNDAFQKKELEKLIKKSKEIANKIDVVEERLLKSYKRIADDYCEKVNGYLQQFTESIIIIDVKPVIHRTVEKVSLVFSLNVAGNDILLENRADISFDYLLSDGDKSAISLSSYLAKIDMYGDIQNKIVVIDDPFTSFDKSRRNKTISLLSKLTNKVQQFILLTHDMDFANGFMKSIHPKKDILTLQLKKNQQITDIQLLNINDELQLDVIRNMKALNNYLQNGASSYSELINLKGTIRVVLEGILKIKYCNYDVESKWLGEIINLIENANEENNAHFVRLKGIVDRLSELNAYSKTIHHSNPNENTSIEEGELRIYVRECLDVLEYI